MPWIIAGDMNITKGAMLHWCKEFILPDVDCISGSGWPELTNANKPDFALSQGINLTQVQSWVGISSQPCATDAHDAVVVMGSLELQRRQRPPTPSSSGIPSNGIDSSANRNPQSKTVALTPPNQPQQSFPNKNTHQTSTTPTTANSIKHQQHQPPHHEKHTHTSPATPLAPAMQA